MGYYKELYPNPNGYSATNLVESVLEKDKPERRKERAEEMVRYYKKKLRNAEIDFDTRDLYERRLAAWLAGLMSI